MLEQVLKGDAPMMKLLREYTYTLQKVSSGLVDSEHQKTLLALTQKMDELEAWTIESEVKSILTRLGIVDFEADVSTLSGGQRKRIAMASALISRVDLLILDEPTNHIDNDAVDWLEQYLSQQKGALLMVTHDRYFLERVCNRIIELDRGNLYSYQANYSKYLEMKAERQEIEKVSQNKRQRLLKKELEWIRAGAKARTTKQKARIGRFEKLKDENVRTDDESVTMKVGSTRLGKKIIELTQISKGFSDMTLIKDFSYIVLRDDRIGVIGANGIGKSTLLKIIAGKLTPASGNLQIGETVKIGYFSQENEEMNEDLRVIEYIREEAEFISTSDGSISASQMLERFLFPPAVQWTPIAKLSGGEKRRLFLLRILMGAPNVLLLDEPTNDLDIETLTILEDYLDEFTGAVIVVSHDRYFLDRIANKIFAFEGSGIITKYTGNYTDYRAHMQQTVDATAHTKETIKEKEASDSEKTRKNKARKFTFKEQREFEQIDTVIASLEKELEQIDGQISEAQSDFVQLQALTEKQTEVEAKLSETMKRWVYLNELAEEIAKNKK